MAFKADERFSKIVAAYPTCENFTSPDSRATAAEMVANMRSERRWVLENNVAIMVWMTNVCYWASSVCHTAMH
jgi:hypothetical protein